MSVAGDIVLGIDPGLANTGWGIIASVRGSRGRASRRGHGAVARAYGVITTSPDKPLAVRLSAIHDGVIEVIEHYHPDSCALEGVFFGVNAQAALSLGQARGAAILATAAQGLPLGEYPPALIKSTIVGEGRADKTQIIYMMRQWLGLDHDPKPDHCADALAVALTHMVMSTSPLRAPDDTEKQRSESAAVSRAVESRP
jgi:crossover junction endodeoxyribonuclease RuvC